jgi:hypothetical protein
LPIALHEGFQLSYFFFSSALKMDCGAHGRISREHGDRSVTPLNPDRRGMRKTGLPLPIQSLNTRPNLAQPFLPPTLGDTDCLQWRQNQFASWENRRFLLAKDGLWRSWTYKQGARRQIGHKPRSAVFATHPRRHRLSSMASESLNSSHEDVHGSQVGRTDGFC